jgi:hypothetical protein
LALRDLLVKFGVQVDGDKKLEATDVAIRRTLLSANRLGNTFRQMGNYLLVGALVNGVKNFVESQIEQANALKYNAERLGISSDELQRYTYVADIMGIKTEQVAVGMRYFNRTVGEAALGTKSATKEFALLGINIKDSQGNIRPTGELLGEFSDKLKAMPNQALRTAHAMRVLGRGGSSMLPELQKGSAALKQMFKDVDELGGGFNEVFVKQAAEVNVELKRLKLGWRSVTTALLTEVLPYFKRWIDRGIETVKTLIDLAKKTYGFRTALMFLVTGAAFFALSRFIGLFKLGKMGVAEFMGILLRNAPLVAFVALLTAAYLIFDDLYTFMQGGDSVIGRFLDKMGGDGTALQFWHDMKDAIAAVRGVFDGMGFSLKGIIKEMIDDAPQAMRIMGLGLIGVIKYLDYAVTGMRELKALLDPTSDFGDAGKRIEELTNGLNARMDAINKLGDVFNEIGDPVAIARKRAASFAPGGDNFSGPLPAGAPTPAPAGGTTTIDIKNTFHVASDTPEKTSWVIGDKLKKQIAEAVEEQKQRDTWNAVNAGIPIAN